MAVAVVHLWEEHGLIGAGGVLEGEELHGVAVLCEHGLPCDQPADGGDLFTHMAMKIPGANIVSAFENIAIKIEGVDRQDKTQGLGFVLEHEVWGVWGLF